MKLKEMGYIPFKIHKLKVVPLQQVFDEQGITQIDFIDLDVENMELDILKGIDFEKTEICILLVEQRIKEVETCIGSEVWEFLNRKGYYLIGKIGNRSIYEKRMIYAKT